MSYNPWNKIVWTDEQIDFIKSNWESMTSQQMAAKLGLKNTSVRTKRYELGLYKLELEYWTDEQINLLQKNYKTMGDVELAELFNKRWHKNKGWTKKHIEKKRRYLKLKRTVEEKEQIHQRNVEQGRFAMCPVKAWDKRGRPEFGTIRVWQHKDGTLFKAIKVKEGFVHYAPWLWRWVHGPIPDGFIVRTKNDNTLEVTPGNLELITRSQHAIRNSKSRLPQELRELINLNNKLKKRFMNEVIEKKIHALLNKKVKYGMRIITVTGYRIDVDKERVYLHTNEKNDHYERPFDGIISFLKELQPVEMSAEKQESMSEMIMSQTQNMSLQLQTVLLDNIERVQKDKAFIPQATAINNSINSLINLKKLELDYVKTADRMKGNKTGDDGKK